ncbi:MAG TPA: alkaline phosphatase family protein, partial [Microlunatus sp.]
MRPLTLVAISALVITTALAPVNSAKSASVDTSATASSSASAGWKDRPRYQPRLPGGYKNLVVLFQENHSFDNLYGGWGRVGRQRVEGLPEADRRHTIQRAQDGSRYRCLPQVDVNLTSPPLLVTCTDSRHDVSSAFRNRPFSIDDYIEPTDTTCPVPGAEQPNGTLNGQGLPGGCTRDLVHRFYQEKFQSNGGRQDRYVTGSDAVGLSMGHYDTTRLPIYRYLHSAGAPHYVIADRFFAGAHGGSFLNHQWLIAGRAPVVDQSGNVPDPTKRPRNSVIDSNGMPTAYPQYEPTSSVLDGELTVRCANPDRLVNYRRGCGNFAVNTVQPASAPYSPGGPFIPLINNARYPNIGDRLTAEGISWNWYSGGWDDAEAGNPGPLFQYHHQPFNYFADYAPGTPGRSHLQDEENFFRAARTGNLP